MLLNWTVAGLTGDQTLPKTAKLRPVRYLSNIVEQDHRFIKRLVNPGMGFASFNTARQTLRGYEAMNMIRKGQIEGVEKDIKAQVEFVSWLTDKTEVRGRFNPL